jgi:hypothetical protein
MKKLQKTIVTLFLVCVLLTAVSFAGCIGGDEEKKEEVEINPDKDADGMLDEWEDMYGSFWMR